MNIESFRNYCLAKKGAVESLPFDNKTLVFKVAGKMFALAGIENLSYVNLKCDPEKAIDYREQYKGVRPGFHMNKKHWNSVYLSEDIWEALFVELLDHSYQLVIESLTKKAYEELQNR